MSDATRWWVGSALGGGLVLLPYWAWRLRAWRRRARVDALVRPCLNCGRPFHEHSVFNDAGFGLSHVVLEEADFGPGTWEWLGVYCPTRTRVVE